MVEFIVLNEYSGALACSLIVITILCNIAIIMKIKYGQVLITKTTLKPYYLAFVYLILSYVNMMIREYLETTKTTKKFNLKYWNNVDGDIIVAVARFIDSITIVLFVYFIAVRINSCAIVN